MKYKILIIVISILLLSQFTNAEIGQMSEKELDISSPVFDGDESSSDDFEMVYSTKVEETGKSSLRLYFGDTNLGDNSFVKIVSLEDGIFQKHTGASLSKWNNTTIFFNGDSLLVELYLNKNDENVFINLNNLLYDSTNYSIVNNDDDRTFSSNGAVGRLYSEMSGCWGTAWITSKGALVTNRHMTFGNYSLVEFNVPDSDEYNGYPKHPGQEDQYLIKNTINAGHDWKVFRVEDNDSTGLQPIEAQYASFDIEIPDSNNLVGEEILIVGYGTDDEKHKNLTQQKSIGVIEGLYSSEISYSNYTTGGNSGSPIISVSSGKVIGVHWGACGTTFINKKFWNTIDSLPLFSFSSGYVEFVNEYIDDDTTNLCGDLSFYKGVIDPEINPPSEVQSGSSEYVYYDYSYTLWTHNENRIYNGNDVKHISWNFDSTFKMIRENFEMPYEEKLRAEYEYQKNVTISSDAPVLLQLKDPWYVSSINSYSKIATQPNEFRPLSESNYNVFLNQGDLGDLEPPYYSVRASERYYVTQDGIYEFDRWESPNNKASFQYPNELVTAVVFTGEGEGSEVEAIYEAVNEIPNYTLTIANDESLTIPAGANFTCAEGFTIEVEGDLTIAGTETEPVTITGSGNTVVNELFKINNSTSNVNISNTTIQNTDCALSIEQASNVTITNTEISGVNKAIKIGQTENADITLDFVQIKNSNSGILFEEGFKDASQESRLTVTHSVFSNITNYGIYIIQPDPLNNSSSEQYIDIIQNTFYNCGNDGLCYFDPPSGPFADVYFDISNTIFDNSDISMISNEGFIDFGYSSYNLFHNSSGYGDIDVNAVFGDPLFINVSVGDFHLSYNSPAVDAGREFPPINDPDGTQGDIGAYYLPHTLITGDIHGDIDGLTIFEGNDVTITDDIEVESDATMYVRPGTVIEVEAGSQINVYGELRAEGTASNKIKFTKNGSSDWGQIYARSNSTVYLNNTIIEDCSVGLHADNASSVNIFNSEFKNTVAGIWMQNCNSNNINNNSFDNNDYGLYLMYATTNLNGNDVINNNDYGIYVNNSYGNYKYNTISNNNYGLYIYRSSPDLTMAVSYMDIDENDTRNNLIEANNIGVYISSSGTPNPQLGDYTIEIEGGPPTFIGGYNVFDNVSWDVKNYDNEVDARLNIWVSDNIYGNVEIDPDFYEFLDEWGLNKTTNDEEDISENIIYMVADSLIADSLFTEAMEEYESLIDEMPNEDISKKTLVNIVALNRRLMLDSLYQEQFTDKTLVERLEKISSKYSNTPVGDLSLDMQVTANNWAGEYKRAVLLGDDLYTEYYQNDEYEAAANILYEQSSALRYLAETETDDLSKSEGLIKQSKAKADLILSQYSESSVANAVRLSRGLAPIITDEPISNTTPQEYALHQCYPNPFNPVTNIGFDLPKDSKISLIAYDVMGRKVWEYENNGTVMNAGKYEIQWDGKTTEKRQLASGIYLIQLRTAGFVDVKKVVLLK